MGTDRHLLLRENTLIIKVENSKGNTPPQLHAAPHEGIGLQNVKRRLNLIDKDQHDLQIFEES